MRLEPRAFPTDVSGMSEEERDQSWLERLARAVGRSELPFAEMGGPQESRFVGEMRGSI